MIAHLDGIWPETSSALRRCTEVDTVSLGGDPLTVVSTRPGQMVLAFDREAIEQDLETSQLLSIRCVGGVEEQFEVYVGAPSVPGSVGPTGPA